MSRQLWRAAWERITKQVHEGDWRDLLKALLSPPRTDSHGNPLPDPETGLRFVPLPDEYELRLLIVRALVFGPKGSATTIDELASKSGWGTKKPKVHDDEIAMAALADDIRRHGLTDGVQPDLESFADSLGIDVDTLKRRVQGHRRARRRI